MNLIGHLNMQKSKKIVAGNHCVNGIIVSVKRVWWLRGKKDNLSSVFSKGGASAHKITFTYKVNGTDFSASQYVIYASSRPTVDQTVTVYYEKDNPSHATVPAFV